MVIMFLVFLCHLLHQLLKVTQLFNCVTQLETQLKVTSIVKGSTEKRGINLIPPEGSMMMMISPYSCARKEEGGGEEVV